MNERSREHRHAVEDQRNDGVCKRTSCENQDDQRGVSHEPLGKVWYEADHRWVQIVGVVFHVSR